jgi:hypothetical protein
MRHLNLRNYYVDAILAGLALEALLLTCQVQSSPLKVQHSMMDLTGQLNFLVGLQSTLN